MSKTPLLILFLFSSSLHAATAPWMGADLNGIRCKGPEQSFGAYGPYDYVTQREKVNIVEIAHFAPESEQLIKPMQGSFPGDFDYTLRAIPNHHRALLSTLKYQLQLNAKLKRTQPLVRAVECYMQRAMHFSPHDPVPFTLYAYYLHKIGHNDIVPDLYEQALQLAPNSSKVMYSYALYLVDEKKYEKAAELAKAIYKNPKAPNGLKNKLIKLNAWH